MLGAVLYMKSATGESPVADIWRRAWDLNPRGFHLPVFKTGALGRYASPPWDTLLKRGVEKKSAQIGARLSRQLY